MATKIAFEIDIKGSKEVFELQKQIKALKLDLKKNTDPTFTEQALKDLALLEVRLKESQRQARIAQAELTAKDTTIGSYARLSASLTVARERFKELAASQGLNTKATKDAERAAAALQKQLADIDAKTGVFGRNVGNYANSLKGLFGQLKGALSQSLLVGNIRNVPQLLGMVSGAYETLVGWVDEYRDSTEAAYAVNKKLNESVNEAIGAFAKENSELQTVFDSAKNTTQGTEAHNTAITAINETYGQYLPNLLDENSSLTEIEQAQTLATDALVKNTIAKIKAATASKIITQLFEKELELARAQESINKGGFVNFVNDLSGLNAAGIKVLQEQSTKTQDELKLVGKAAEGAEAQLKKLSTLDVSLFDLLGAGSTDAEKKVAEAAKKATNKAAESLRKEVEKEREKILKSEAEFGEKQAAEIAKLQSKISQLVVDGIEDEGTKALAQENLNFDLRRIAREEEYNKLIAQITEREAQILAAFGESSKELADFRAQSAADIAKITEQYNKITQLETANHQAILKAIEKKGAAERLAEADKAEKERTEALQKDLDARLQLDRDYIAELDRNMQLDILKLQESLAKREITVQQAADKEFQIKKKSLSEQLAAVQATLDFETQLTEDQRAELVLQAQKLNTDLAQLEEDRTAKVEEEEERRRGEREKAIIASFEIASQIFDFGQQISDVVLAQEEARLQKQLDFRNQNIENLKESLAKQSGLEAQFTQQRIDAEVEAAKKIEKAQKEARKRAAIANKAFAIAQATINAALSITNLLATLIDPTPVQAFKVAALAITAGINIAQIGIIAATPLKFAKGGYTGKGTGTPDNTGFKTTGVVHEGEWVAPKWMVDSPRFSGQIAEMEAARQGSAVVPNIASMPINAVTQGGSPEMLKLLLETNALSKITANKLNSLEVLHTTKTQRDIDKDQKEVKFIDQQTRL